MMYYISGSSEFAFHLNYRVNVLFVLGVTLKFKNHVNRPYGVMIYDAFT